MYISADRRVAFVGFHDLPYRTSVPTAMTTREPRYSKEEFARHGDGICERDISHGSCGRPLVEAEHKGEFVAIDVETGAWEIRRVCRASCPVI